MITTRDADDAIEYLGEDYPFLIDSPDEGQVLSVMEEAEDLFGTAAWDDVLQRMEDVKHRVSPERIAQEMTEILAACS